MGKYRRAVMAVIFLPLLTAAGCEQRYRYPCQNPENWDRPECQRPLCEVNRDCPDLIFKDDSKAMKVPVPAAPTSPRGECK